MKINNSKTKVLLCASVRLENQYIEEWIRYYQNLGVDKIVIFDNNVSNTELITDVPYVKQLADEGYIDVWIQPDRRGMQTAQYTECYNIYYKDYDWLMFFDIDEFLMFKDFDNVKDFLSQEKFEQYDMIHIQWKVYDDNNILTVKNNNYSMLERFTHPIDIEKLLGTELDENSYGYCYNKTIVKGRNYKKIKFTFGNSHTPSRYDSDKNLICCNSKGEMVEPFVMAHKFEPDKDAWLNHYICKTIEEYMKNKMVRCCGSLPSERGEKARVNLKLFLKYNNLTFEKLKYIHDFDPEQCEKLLNFITICCARYAHNLDETMTKVGNGFTKIPIIKRVKKPQT